MCIVFLILHNRKSVDTFDGWMCMNGILHLGKCIAPSKVRFNDPTILTLYIFFIENIVLFKKLQYTRQTIFAQRRD